VLRPGTPATEQWEEHVVPLDDVQGEATRFQLTTRLVVAPGADRSQAVAVPLWGAPEVLTAEREDERPNVILVSLDTLRRDYVGALGSPLPLTPHIDALARSATLFEHAFSYWPKTRGSFTMIHTGRFPSQNGFDAAAFPLLASFNPTLASLLKDAGYETVAAVDNPNVAAALGYAKGFDRYLETWQQPELRTEMDRTRAITEEGKRVVRAARGARPLFLWLHYVNPHAPYSPPAPFDTRFLDAAANAGPELRLRPGFHGGIPRTLFVSGHRQLGWYVAQYDGEIAAVDEQIGRVLGALHASALAANTVVVLTSDHGESLGEHDYYFDHGEDLFDGTLAVPLIVAVPEGVGRHSSALAWSLDLLPTILEAAGVPRPEGLPGQSLVGQVEGHHAATHERLFAQNEEGLVAAWNAAYKIVAAPGAGGATTFASRPHPATSIATSKGIRVPVRRLVTTVASTIATATSRDPARCRGWRPARRSSARAP